MMGMASIDDLDRLMARKNRVEAHAAESPEFGNRLRELRAWQANRLAGTYEDFRKDARYAAATEFFLKDLYGPQAVARRDRELERAWRYFKRALPGAALDLLQRAVALDVQSAELDEAMARHIPVPLTAASYAAAYRKVGRAAERRRQIDLLVAIGEDLGGIVGRPWIGLALRSAHYPANAAGFGVLQDFLEKGLQAFRQMRGARDLMAAIRERETDLMAALLKGNDQPGDQPLETAKTSRIGSQ
jgi:hypothetical protein